MNDDKTFNEQSNEAVEQPQLEDNALTLEDITFMSKFGRIISLRPLEIEYDFTILDRALTEEEHTQYQAIIEKLCRSIPQKVNYDENKKAYLAVNYESQNDFSTQEGFVDFFSQFLSSNNESETITAVTNLVYGNVNAPAMPNTPFFDMFVRALISPQNIKSGKFTNRHEHITVTETKNDFTVSSVTTTTGGEVKTSITIKNIKKNYNKRNANLVRLFVYLFQKLAEMPGASSVYVTYEELVQLGIYDTVDGSRRGVNNFYDYFHGKDSEDPDEYIPRVSIIGKLQTKSRKIINQPERDLITGREIFEGAQRIDFNEKIDMRLFTEYISFLPLWTYRLKNIDAFLLARYIFYTARMNGANFKNAEKEDQLPNHHYKIFELTFESIRDELGLPAPAEVTGRKYKEKIRQPIEKAIEDIEEQISKINDPEQTIIVTLTPKATDQARNIEEFLMCKLEIGIIDTFADSFIKASKQHEKKLTEFKKKVEAKTIEGVAKGKVSPTDCGA